MKLVPYSDGRADGTGVFENNVVCEILGQKLQSNKECKKARYKELYRLSSHSKNIKSRGVFETVFRLYSNHVNERVYVAERR